MSSITRRRFLKLSAAGALGLTLPNLGCTTKANAGKRPNIIVIMADDMGFSDVGCYGGDIQTPNIDRLADNGLRFNQFYNAARCCPTRASLMTGQYQHKVNMATNGNTLGRNGVTIAEALGASGYNTGMVGKWHLSATDVLADEEKQQAWLNHQYHPDRPFAPLDTYPVNRGFDRHYGIIWGVANYFDPFSLVDGTEPVKNVPDDYYLTRAINNHSVDYIRDFAKEDDPFFLYVAHAAPHWPLHALEEDIKKYEDQYLSGWNKLREERFQRQLEMGMFSENVTLPPVQDRGTEWKRLPEDEKRYMARKMAVHAAMIDHLDQGVGMITDTLEEAGELENTLILFMSDNGSSPETPKDWGPGFDRPSETRQGQKVHYENISIENMGSETSYAGIGPAWASATNTPFRYWKAEQYEGGAHTPCIAHWPNGLSAEPGSTTEEVGHVMDILPTCLELAGADYPDEYNGHKITPLDGKSLTPILNGEQREGYEQLFFEHVGGKAMMKDGWKIVSLRKNNDPWHLYNIEEDPTETNNLADKYPDKLKQMGQSWTSWAKSVGLEGESLNV